MTTDQTPDSAPAATGHTASAPREGVLSITTRWVLVLHTALLAAQPFLAGAMLDAMSPEPQTMHRMVAMTLVAVSIVQVVLTLVLWKGRAAWPKEVFQWSAVLLVLELIQFTLGHLSLAMAMHIPLGIASLAFGVFIAVRFGRRNPAAA